MSQPAESEESRQPVAPIALAMVICDQIYIDPVTGKKSLLGMFTAYTSTEFPCNVPGLAVYLAISSGRGVIPIILRLIDVDEENDALFKAEGSVELADPTSVGELTVQIPGIQFPAPGEYRFQFFAYQELIIERRIIIVAVQETEA